MGCVASSRLVGAAAVMMAFVSACGDGDEAVVSTTTVAPSTTWIAAETSTVTSALPSTSAAPTADLATVLADLVPARLVELQVPGAAVVVLRDGEVVFADAFGSTPAGEQISVDTLFQVGSTSKLVAAITAASLAADGVMPWDTDLAPVLTAWSIPPGAQSADHPVTAAGITSHTAGFTVDGFLGYPTDQPLPTRPELLSGLGSNEPVVVGVEPGSEYRYSGGGYEVLAQAIEDAAGRPYGDVVAERVFAPAGMASSGYLHPLPDELAARATGGAFQGEAMPSRWQLHPEHAAAGLWTTGSDMAAFLSELTAALRGESDAMLDQTWAQRLATPVIEDPDGGWVGHGTFITDNERWFSHGGRNIGYCSSNAISIDGRFAAAVLTNGFPGGSDLGGQVLDAIATAEQWPDWG
jgi:CubicO group peptidase (beta-lactamase class C family)